MLPARDEFWIDRVRRDRDYHRATFAAVVTAVNGDGTVDVRLAATGGGSFYRVPVMGQVSVSVGSIVTVQRIGLYRGNNYQVIGHMASSAPPGGGVQPGTPASVAEEVVAARDSSVYGAKVSLDARIEAVDTDVDAHKANADAHHAQSHVLATDSALGPDHTISGGVAGHVLRALSATAAKFMQLVHGDLGGVSADQHHAQVHAAADHSAANIIPNAAQDLGANTLDITQRATPSNPGAGIRRLFVDSGDGKFKALRSDGVAVSLEEQGGATADHPHGAGQAGGALGAGVVGATQLAANAVETAKILDANVTAAKLASDSVITAKILDANVTTAKIADAAVTAAKIGSQAVRPTHLGLGTVPCGYDARNLIPDGFFEVDLDADGTPDWWSWPAASAGTRTLDTAESVVGRRSVRYDRTGAGAIDMLPAFRASGLSWLFCPIDRTQSYTCGFYVKRNDSGLGNSQFYFYVEHFDRTGAYLTYTTVIDVGAPTTWTYYSGTITSASWHANARFARVLIRNSSNNSNVVDWIDSVVFRLT